MPIIKAITNPQTRQTTSFHKLMSVALDRMTGLTLAHLVSWIDEDDFKTNPNNPISVDQIVFGPNQVDIGRRPISNIEEVKEKYWQAYQLTKTP